MVEILTQNTKLLKDYLKTVNTKLEKPHIKYGEILEEVGDKTRTYNIPIQGDVEILKYRPSDMIYSSTTTILDEEKKVLSFSVPEKANKQQTSFMKDFHMQVLQENISNLGKEVDDFNNNL